MTDTAFAFWSFKQVVSGILLPPGGLIILVAVALCLARWKAWRIAGLVAAVALAASCMPAVGYWMTLPIERAWPPFKREDASRLPAGRTAIAVLGGGRRLGALEHDERETLSPASLRRVVYGYQLARDSGLPLVFAGGRPAGGRLSEAALMKALVEQFGQAQVMLIEDTSNDTRGNATELARLLGPRQVDHLVLVTDVVHMSRASSTFRSAGFDVVAAPVNYQATSPLTVGDFVPSARGLEITSFALHELLGQAWYAITSR